MWFKKELIHLTVIWLICKRDDVFAFNPCPNPGFRQTKLILVGNTSGFLFILPLHHWLHYQQCFFMFFHQLHRAPWETDDLETLILSASKQFSAGFYGEAWVCFLVKSSPGKNVKRLFANQKYTNEVQYCTRDLMTLVRCWESHSRKAFTVRDQTLVPQQQGAIFI